MKSVIDGCLMTRLDQLRKNHISIECKCGYSVLLPITELLNYVKPETTLEQVSHIARYRCHRKGKIDFGCTMCGFELSFVFKRPNLHKFVITYLLSGHLNTNMRPA